MMRFASLLILWLPFAMAATSTYTPCTLLCITQASKTQLEAIPIRVYTGSSLTEYKTATVANVSALSSYIDLSKKSVTYIYGWLGSSSQNITVEVLSALLSRGDLNVFLYDWEKIANNEYTYTVNSLEGVGWNLATILNKLVANNYLNASTLELVGHSLGAQMCGYTGSYINFTLPRTVGLDPAGPLYYLLNRDLTSDDAEYVEIIHTNAGEFGIAKTLGDVDFWVNGGSFQPGCETSTNVLCSHNRAVSYYADSVKNSSCFIGVACDSYSEFEAGSCSSNAEVEMGYGTPTTATGSYYLQTNSKESYCRGGDGTTYSSSDA